MLIQTWLLLLASAGHSASGTGEAEALAEMTYELGAQARLARLDEDDLLYRCGRVALCAGPCRDHLVAIANGRKSDKTCPALAGVPAGSGAKARAAALVRKWIDRAAREHRSTMSDAGRERLDCGLGRLSLRPARPKACLAEDDRRALASLPQIAGMQPATVRVAVAGFCAELESCSGGCGEVLTFLTQVDWNAVGGTDGPPAPPGCPAFKSVTTGSPAQGRDRAWLFVRERGRLFLESLCKRAVPAQRLEIACSGAKLGVLDGSEACGRPPASCPPKPPGE